MEIKLSITSILLFLCSCVLTEPYYVSEFYIYNQSEVKISLILFNNKNNDTLTIEDGKYFYKKIGDEGGDFPRPFLVDSIKVVFHGKKELLYTWDNRTIRNPLLLDSYEETKISKTHCIFKYTFIKKDYMEN